MSAPRLPWNERACDGQTTWGVLRLCELRSHCLRFVAADDRRRYLSPREVGEGCGDFLPITETPDAGF